MTITFRLPPEAVERVSFTYSPLLETVLSLHVLVEPKHHPLQHQWVRRMQSLAPSLKRDIRELAFAYRSYFPAYLFPPPTGEPQAFEDELRGLAELPIDAVQEEFAVAFVGQDARNAAVEGRVAEALRSHAASPEASEPDVAARAAHDPAGLIEQLSAVLGEYWEAAFAQEWERIEPRLAESVSEAGENIAAYGLYDLLQRFQPEIRASEIDGRFSLDRPHDHEVVIGEGMQLALVPSVYVWPHVRVNCDDPWPLAVVFPASFLLREARVAPAPGELRRVFRALSDGTRLQALRLMAVRPRSTEELAPLLNITPAALSKHLHQLADVGLVQAERQGYYVLYRADMQRLSRVGSTLQRFVVPDDT